MKENKHEVITQGTPNLNNMPKEVFNVFCTSLLAAIEDYYKEETYAEEDKPQEKKQ